MSRVPWITIVLGIAAVLNPVGLSFIQNALFAAEALSRNIAGPILAMGIAIWAALVLIELLVRWRIDARRKNAAQQNGATGG